MLPRAPMPVGQGAGVHPADEGSWLGCELKVGTVLFHQRPEPAPFLARRVPAHQPAHEIKGMRRLIHRSLAFTQIIDEIRRFMRIGGRAIERDGCDGIDNLILFFQLGIGIA